MELVFIIGLKPIGQYAHAGSNPVNRTQGVIMKYLFPLIIFLIPSITLGGVDELRQAIDYEMQKVRYVAPIQEKTDRGNTVRMLSKFNKVGFQPVISLLPRGASFSVGPVVISADRRYVRIGIAPVFSNIGRVDTFNFGR